MPASEDGEADEEQAEQEQPHAPRHVLARGGAEAPVRLAGLEVAPLREIGAHEVRILVGAHRNLQLDRTELRQLSQRITARYHLAVLSKAETTEYYKGWHDAMEGITYEAQNYLPGVDPDTGLLNGSVRTYGHWSGTKSDSGKTFKGLWYHYLTFDENGKIINGGDFGDATGLIMSVMPDQE